MLTRREGMRARRHAAGHLEVDIGDLGIDEVVLAQEPVVKVGEPPDIVSDPKFAEPPLQAGEVSIEEKEGTAICRRDLVDSIPKQESAVVDRDPSLLLG